MLLLLGFYALAAQLSRVSALEHILRSCLNSVNKTSTGSFSHVKPTNETTEARTTHTHNTPTQHSRQRFSMDKRLSRRNIESYPSQNITLGTGSILPQSLTPFITDRTDKCTDNFDRCSCKFPSWQHSNKCAAPDFRSYQTVTVKCAA